MKAIIFVNGELQDAQNVNGRIQPGDFLIAADGGFRHLAAINRLPNLVIGDFDSLTTQHLESITAHNIPQIRLAPQKDETDLEIAIQAAVDMGCKEILLAAATGGRLDHTLANLMICSKADWQAAEFILTDGVEDIYLLRKSKTIHGAVGDLISLLPLSETVTGVFTMNLAYPLNHETLFRTHARGISNVMASNQATIQIESGILLCFHIPHNKDERQL